MGKTPLAALGFVIALSVSTSLTPVQAMPAPAPTSTDLNAGLSQWGAESVAAEPADHKALKETVEDLARPFPKTASKASLCETLAEAAQKHNLPVGFFVRLINQESRFNPEAVSPVGAQGVAQFMPRVAEEWGLKNPFEPHSALVASARFLRSLFDQFGNWGLAAAAYNGGMGRVQKWVDKRGKLPNETRHYVKTITGLPAEQWANGKPQQANFSIPKAAPCQEIAHLADPPPVKGGDDAPPSQPKVTEVAVVTKTKGKRSETVITSKTEQTNTGATQKTQVAIVTTKGKNGGKVVVSKVASVKSKIAAPETIVAEKSSGKVTAKGKKAVVNVASGKDKKVRTAVVPSEKAEKKGKDKNTKVADKAEKAPAKGAKAKPEKADSKKAAKGRVQVAEATAGK
jgi:soluble lytic murein transglycosylase-like protein